MERSVAMERHILIVDDEVRILNALERLLEYQQGYFVYRAESAEEGLSVLAKTPQIGVVLSDQRMPGMSGTEFLKQVRKINNHIVRIILSGYSELNTIIHAINEGAIFKFLMKPWDDNLLLDAISESFEYYEIFHQNQLLTEQLQHTNALLSQFNDQLQKQVELKTHDLELHVASLKIYQELLEQFPFGVIGLDDELHVVLENNAARATFTIDNTSLLGLSLRESLKGQWSMLSESAELFFSSNKIYQTHLEVGKTTISLFKVSSRMNAFGKLIISSDYSEL